MKVGILGSGVVGQSLAAGFLKSGHEVRVGSREPGKLNDWLASAGENASAGSFSDTASFGELIVLCCKGAAVEGVISLAGKENLAGKTVVDVTNHLVFDEEGKPPKLAEAYPHSLGLKVQEMLPESMVVKAFNIVTAAYMCNPRLEEGTPDMFIAGNDQASKDQVKAIAEEWGWPVHDLGGIEQAYLMEALAMLWIRYGFLNNHWTHAFRLLKK